MKLTKFSLTQRSEWDQTLSAIPHAFFHTPDCVEAICKTHPAEASLYVFEDSDQVACVPLLLRKYNSFHDLLTPYGYSGLVGRDLSLSFLSKIAEALAKENVVCSYISNHPLFTTPVLLESPDYFQANTSFVNDLTLSEEEIIQGMNDGKRRQIKLKGATFSQDKTLLKASFIELYRLSMERLGAGSYYAFTTETLELLVASPRTRLIGTIQDEKIVACTLLGETPYIADFLLNGATDEGRRHSSALLWRGMQAAIENKIPSFNFGGGITAGDSLANFKSLFGGRPMPFGAFKFIHNEAIYQQLCTEKNITAPQDRSGFFPAYHRKN